jgi:glycosyltransferase involved in cell wall biosynthesis
MERLVFAAKAFLLQRKRMARNLFSALPKSRPRADFPNGVLLAQSVSLLRSDEETAPALVDGKIHNIRNVIKKLDGVVFRAGEVFSFWRHVGRLTRAQGYALGRELREGCIIPQIGSGICQLTNAIYDAGMQAGLAAVERHRHSQIIKGSLAELDRDATVFWNYLDLRLKGTQNWQLQVAMDKTHLTVSIFGETKNPVAPKIRVYQAPARLGDCTQCGRTDCHSHVGDMPAPSRKTHLGIDEDWAEFSEWRKRDMKKGDRFVSTSDHAALTTKAINFFAKLRRRHILWMGARELRRAEKFSMRDGQHPYNWRKFPIPAAHNVRFNLIARHFAKKLDFSDTHLVIPQPLLVWFYLNGELAGREYDVLMSAMPMSEIEAELDRAMSRYGYHINGGHYSTPDGNAVTLGDYRAPEFLVEAERKALAGATKLVSPHAKILEWAGEKGEPLDWILPDPITPQTKVDATFEIFLAGASLGRKGIFDLRAALRNLDFDFRLLLVHSAVENNNFWDGIPTCHVNSFREGIARCDVAVLPAVVEHNPGGLLLAIASQKPVIASSACGLPENMNWQRADDAGELERALRQVAAATRTESRSL